MDRYDPYLYYKLGGRAAAALLIYWRIWKINAQVANWIVFGITLGVTCYLINWDYALNHYFRVTEWKLP